MCVCVEVFLSLSQACLHITMGSLRLAGSLKLSVSFAKEPYKRDDILQERPKILRSLLIIATPYLYIWLHQLYPLNFTNCITERVCVRWSVFSRCLELVYTSPSLHMTALTLSSKLHELHHRESVCALECVLSLSRACLHITMGSLRLVGSLKL